MKIYPAYIVRLFGRRYTSDTSSSSFTAEVYENDEAISSEEQAKAEETRRNEIAEQYSVYEPYGMIYDKEKDLCRLWYFDNVHHDDKIDSVNERYATTYAAGLKQALADLATWVEKGVEPLPSSNYHINVGQVQSADTAKERGGLQPVVHLYANGTKCAHVKAGETVLFTAEAEVPDGAGSLIWVAPVKYERRGF